MKYLRNAQSKTSLILSIACFLSLTGCEATPTARGPGKSTLGNYNSQDSKSKGDDTDDTENTTDDEETPAQDPDDDVDDTSNVNRSAEVDQDQSGGLTAQWNLPASLGTVRGSVVDAQTGKPVSGSVSVAKVSCAGSGCTAATGQADTYVTPLEAGQFAFDADPPKPAKGEAKPARLTLRPQTAFTVTATGYETLVIAHGPRAQPQTDAQGHMFTALPTLYLCPEGAPDDDTDGICDAAEAGYKTNPNKADEDKDALSDSLEFLGHPKGSDTTYDIRNLGADPHARDIFVAVRRTASAPYSADAFKQVEQAFAGAPAQEPGGPEGIRLHVLRDERPISGADDIKELKPLWPTFRKLTEKYYQERPLAFHYALFGNLYAMPVSNKPTTSSGMSNRVQAAEFVVTLGGFKNPTTLELAGTFMHELGHNLSLQHGGTDDYSYKPGYMSIMNYNYQMSGIQRTTGTALDYARFQTAGINESNVNENEPFRPAGDTTVDDLKTYLNPRVATEGSTNGRRNYVPVPGNLGGALDLNLNGELESAACIAFGIKNADQPTNLPRKYDDDTRNDWATLKFDGGSTGKVGDVEQQSTVGRTIDTEEDTDEPCETALADDMTDEAEDLTSHSDTESSPDEDTENNRTDEDSSDTPDDGAGAGLYSADPDEPEPDVDNGPDTNTSDTQVDSQRPAPMCYAPLKAPKKAPKTVSNVQDMNTPAVEPEVPEDDPDTEVAEPDAPEDETDVEAIPENPTP